MKRILLLAFIFSAHSIYAQKLVTLQEVIQDALLKNYDILLVRTDSVAAAIDYEYKNVFFIPRLNGSASRVWNNNDQKQDFSDGTKRERNNIRSSNLQAADIHDEERRHQWHRNIYQRAESDEPVAKEQVNN